MPCFAAPSANKANRSTSKLPAMKGPKKTRVALPEVRRRKLERLKAAPVMKEKHHQEQPPRQQQQQQRQEEEEEEEEENVQEVAPAAKKKREQAPPQRPPVREEMPIDWRTLAACEVIMDLEDETRRKAVQGQKVVTMRTKLNDQLKANEARRAKEQEDKKEWIRQVRAEAKRAQDLEKEEKRALVEKRLRDRELFRSQAEAHKLALQAERAAQDAADHEQLEKARRSLLSEERRTRRARCESLERQASLKKAIDAEQKLKEQRKLAQWTEENRIAREAIERADEMERRRQAELMQREAQIQGRQRIHAESTGAKEQELERLEQEKTAKYCAEKEKRDHRIDLYKAAQRADLNRKVLAENEFQLQQKQKHRDDLIRARSDERKQLKAKAEQFQLDNDRERRDRLEKQHAFYNILQEQSNLVNERKAKEKIAMNDRERALNQQFLNNILQKPERKKELTKLMRSS